MKREMKGWIKIFGLKMYQAKSIVISFEEEGGDLGSKI